MNSKREPHSRFRCPFCQYFMPADYSYCPTCGQFVRETEGKISIFSLVWRGLAWFGIMLIVIAVLLYLRYFHIG